MLCQHQQQGIALLKELQENRFLQITVGLASSLLMVAIQRAVQWGERINPMPKKEVNTKGPLGLYSIV